MKHKQWVRRGATLSLLLLVGASGLLVRGLSSTLSASVASLAPGPERRRPPAPVPAAVQHEPWARRTAVGANPRLALWPSPYDFDPVGLAPNPYGEIAALAPDPYLEEHDEQRAAAWTSGPHERSTQRRPTAIV